MDLVVGTSIGGLLGSLYSLGYDAAYLDTLIHNVNWDMALSDKVDKKYIPYSRTRYKEKYVLSFPFYYRDEDFKNYLKGDAPFASGRSRQIDLGVEAKDKNRKSIAKQYQPCSYVEIPARQWTEKDVVEIVMPFTIRLIPVPEIVWSALSEIDAYA